MDKLKVVITGNNYIEKIQIINALYKKLKRNYEVHEILNEGLDFEEDSLFGINSDMFDIAIKNEKVVVEKSALVLTPERIFLMLNGLLDFKSHLKEDEYNEVLKNNDVSELRLLDNYDMVFYLKGADDKGLDNWIGNGNLRIIDNVSLNKKVDLIYDEIDKMMHRSVEPYVDFIDITNYDTSYYETYGKCIDKQTKRYGYFRNDFNSDIYFRRVMGDDSSYHYKELTEEKGKTIIRYDMEIDKEDYDNDEYRKYRLKYVRNEKEIYFYEDNTLYKIIIGKTKKKLYILSGEQKMPKHLNEPVIEDKPKEDNIRYVDDSLLNKFKSYIRRKRK